jgi:hypothetical protein
MKRCLFDFLRGKEWFKITEMKKQKTGYVAVERKYYLKMIQMSRECK